jgi:hypothetical protein
MQTRYDFTASGGMLYSAVWILLLGTLASALLPRLKVLDLLIAGSGALVFCCYLVYDVQVGGAGGGSFRYVDPRLGIGGLKTEHGTPERVTHAAVGAGSACACGGAWSSQAVQAARARRL